MKICHVTSAHERYDTRIFHKECKSLANNGWDVYLLVNDKDADCCIDNVNIVSTEFEPKTRYERMVLSRKYIKRKCLEIDADIYHLHDPELFAIIGFLKRHGKKVIFDSHEDYVSTIKDKGWIPSKLRKIVSAAFGRYEKKIISKVDGAVVCYHWTRDRYQEYLPEKKVSMILNYPIINDDEYILPSFDNNIISYAGGISGQWCHEYIIKALNQIDDNVTYNLAGDINSQYGTELQMLDGWAAVNYLGKLPQQEVESKVYKKSCAGMAVLDYITQCKGNIGNLSNTKFFEYMKAGIPLICTDFILWKEIVDKEDCGICVNPHSIEDIAHAIKYIINNKEAARRMGENGRKAIEREYNWGTEEKRLIAFYNNL